METKEILHKIRNPCGLGDNDIREARLAAADLIEELEYCNKQMVRSMEENNIPLTTR